MAESVVGVLRAILTADTAQFDTGMRKAALSTEQLEKKIKELTPTAERMAKSFSGDRLLNQATALAAAVTKVGGATKLTEAEQARVNRTLTDAIAKYRALGQAAPKALLDLADATKKAEVQTSVLSTKMIALGAAAGTFLGNIAANAAQQFGQEILQAVTNGAKLSQLSGGFERLSRSVGETGEAMLRTTRTATKGLIADLDLMAVTNKAILLGLPVTSAEMGRLAQTAVVLGRAMGLDATQALDDLITALGRSSPLLLDNLGLSVKVGEANDAYARSLNKTSNELTDAEKKLAFYTAAMEAASKATDELGGLQLGVVDQLNRLRVAAENFVTGQSRSVNESSLLSTSLGVLADALEKVTQEYKDLEEARRRAAAAGQAGLRAEFQQLKEIEEERSRAQAAGRLTPLPTVPGGFTPRGPTPAEIRDLDKASADLQARFTRLKELGDELFGRDLIARAQDLAGVIGPLSNLSRLSAEQQAEVNRVMTEALGVYERMGAVAPASIRALHGATMQLLPTLNEHVRLTQMLAPALDDAKASLEAYFLVVSSNIEDAFALTAATKALNEELRKRGMAAPDFSAFEQSGATQEARDIAAADRAERAAQRLEQLTQSFRRVQDAVLGNLGTLFAGQFAHDPTGKLKDAAKEAELEYLRLQRTGRATARELQTAFERFRDAEERATFTFGERLRQFWGGIKTSIIDVLNDILAHFIKNFIGGMLKALTGARLGQAFANAIGNSTGGGGIGGTVANVAGSAIPGGVLTGAGGGIGGRALAAGGFTTINAAGLPVTPGLAGAGAPTAAGGVGGLGFLSNPAFWTNPWTIGAAAAITTGLLVWKKGLFRGGAEAMHVNPRRDQFLSQFGNPADKGIGGGGHNLAAILTRLTGMPGGGPLFRSLQMADSVKEFVAAQSAVIGQLAKGGIRNIKPFNFGGFIPPGVTQLAMLHGGDFGELITPLRSHPNASTMGHTVNTYNFTIQAMDGADVKRVLEREVWPRFNRETILNQHGVASSIRRVGQP